MYKFINNDMPVKIINFLHLKMSSNQNCVYVRVQSIAFLGHKLSSTGISLDSQNVKVISEMSKPTSKTNLQRFLGMVAFLSKFIPNLSDKQKNFVN